MSEYLQPKLELELERLNISFNIKSKKIIFTGTAT